MADHVEVIGARELRRTMKSAGDNLGRLKAAHDQAAATVVGRQQAPRRTGALAATVRGSGTNTAAVVRAGYARVPYAAPIHWGWAGHNIEPQPWISTAAQDTEGVWFPIYQRAVQVIVDQVRGATGYGSS